MKKMILMGLFFSALSATGFVFVGLALGATPMQVGALPPIGFLALIFLLLSILCWSLCGEASPIPQENNSWATKLKIGVRYRCLAHVQVREKENHIVVFQDFRNGAVYARKMPEVPSQCFSKLQDGTIVGVAVPTTA